MTSRPSRLSTCPNPEKPVQLVLAFKAHPQERAGQAMICEWTDFARQSEVTEGPTKPAPPRLTARLPQLGHIVPCLS